MYIPTVKEIVTRPTAYFHMCSDGALWYQISYPKPKSKEPLLEAFDTFEFPVPLADTKGGVFKAKEKPIFFMRWIRKHIAFLEKSLKDSE